jgi:serine protease Do
MVAMGLTLPVPSVRAKEGEKVEKEVREIHGGPDVMELLGGGPRLGIGIEEAEGNARGARVVDVRDDSPASKAGIKAGDVVVRFDGEAVRGVAHLRRLVRETPAGKPVSIDVDRGGATQKLTATLEERKVADLGEDFTKHLPEPPDVPEPPMPPHVFTWRGHRDPGDNVFFHAFGGPRKLGIRYQEISGQLADYFGLAEDEGILVVSVDEDGPAAKAGLKAGDVILEIAGKSVRDSEDVRDTVRDLEPGKEAAIKVQRGGKPLDLKVTAAGPKPETRADGQGI